MRRSGAADDRASSGGNRCGHCGVIGGSSPAFFTNGSNFAWKRPSGVQFQVNNGEISGDRELVNFSKEF